ncbi:MAG: Rrf2 family transcriptional regulator [Clostridia bacterium]|nr:Rrf2 family transcriptional regulator [Clostridia bacterium]MBQ4249035.1 Rrf2 family transcriptional regulator [Clostridia bacterium]
MKISTKGRYALRVMLDLAQRQGEGFISLKDISKRQDISKKYLEQIVPALSKSGMLIANRGFLGGYKLADEPKNYTVGEILRLTEGSLAPIACLEREKNDCPRCMECITLPMWQGLYSVITEYLDGVTLQDMLDRYEKEGSFDYMI